MEALKRARQPVREEVEKYLTDLELLLKEPTLNKDEINVKFKLFEVAFERLQGHDAGIKEQLITDDMPEAEEDKEYDEIGEWTLRVILLRQLKEKLMPTPPTQCSKSTTGWTSRAVTSRQLKKKSMPPPPTQSSNSTASIIGTSLKPKTDAYETATLNPSSNETDEVANAALKRQDADKDLQLQVLIREFWEIIISNRISKEKLSLESLFIKFDSNFRAVKSLGFGKADLWTWLFPLVEMCLPEEILYNFYHSPLSDHDGSKDDPPRTRLDILMAFVKEEVEFEQRIDLMNDFVNELRGARTEKMQPNREKKIKKRPAGPTLSSIQNAEMKTCAFCYRSNHSSGECYQGRRMTYNHKINILKKKGLCFRCTGKHLGFQCSSNVRCDICRRGHLTILCKDMKIEKRWSTGTSVGNRGKYNDRASVKRESSGDYRDNGAPDLKSSK